ncbi:MAG: Nif3-like dinuclear metal center hexameric protein [Acidimicrobiia bacterium]|nr:MAG: Nif3-like dinuclear metal center hexameric protein [Acidimicrobiia bacterium]
MSRMVISDFLDALDGSIDLSRAASWDPVGLQIGGYQRTVGEVGVCHEVSDDVLAEVEDLGIDTLVSYHPLLFTPTSSFLEGPSAQGRALRLASAGVSLIVVHTAFDAAPGGSADALAAAIGADVAGRFGCDDDSQDRCIGRFGRIDPTSLSQFGENVAQSLGSPVHVAGEGSQQIESVAVVPGSGGSFIEEAAERADVLVTGDLKHHDVVTALDIGLSIVDAGHIPSERPGVEALYALVLALADRAHKIVVDPNPWKD